MTLLILSFLAGVLTVLAPCVLPLLPVIIGGSMVRGSEQNDHNSWYRPLVISGSLIVSLIVFSLLIQASTALIGVPQVIWQIISGVIITGLGINFLFPTIWTKVALATGLYLHANRGFISSSRRTGTVGDVLIGASLGPVFSSCSPTYAFILAAIIPKNFAEGLVYLTAYAMGLAGMLLIIGYGGQAVASRLGWLVNPTGAFHRAVGVLFILVGLAIGFGVDKDIQRTILERGWYDPIGRFEEKLRV